MNVLARIVTALAALVALPAPARAQDHPNAQAAQLLFDDAKRAAERKDYQSACPMFVRSHELEPAGGTILHAADCHEHLGKLATAWAQYNEALSFALRPPGRPDRERIARARIAALAPRLAKLHVKLSGAKPGFEIWLDGARVAQTGADAETTIPVDAGRHSVEVRGEDTRSLAQELDIEDGEEVTVLFPPLTHAQPATAAPTLVHRQPRPQPAPARERPNTARTLGVTATAVGAAGLVVGTVFGARALSIGDQSDRCTMGPANNGCPIEAVERQDQARTAGVVSTIGFAVGATLLAGGITLVVLAPRLKAQTASTLRLQVGSGVLVTGAF